MRVHPGRRVPLVVDLVAGVAVVLAPEEVVEPDLVQRRRGRVRRQVTADPVAALVRAGDHRGGVPAHDAADPPFHLLVAREPRLLVGRDGVDVRRRHERRHRHLQSPGALEQLADDKSRPHRALCRDQRVEGLEPFAGLGGIRVRELMEEGVERHCATRIYAGGPATSSGDRPGLDATHPVTGAALNGSAPPAAATGGQPGAPPDGKPLRM